MKKLFPIIIFVLLVGGIAASLIYVFTEINPIDDTKRLYINCDGKNEKYNLYLNDKILAFKEDNNCELELSVRDIERSMLKLKSNKIVYYVNPEGEIDDTGSYYDIVVEPNNKLIIYGKDKTTKFTFQYK